MKQILFALVFAGLAYPQGTTFYTWNLQVSPADTAVPVATTLDGAVATANYLFRNTQAITTLASSCAAAATTCTVNAPANGYQIVVGQGICFAVPCAVTATATGGPPPTTFSLTGGEVALVTGVSGTTLTLKRQSIGTAAAMPSGQLVTILAAGSYSWQTAQLLAAAMGPIVQSCTNGAYTTATQCAAIAAAQAAIATAK